MKQLIITLLLAFCGATISFAQLTANSVSYKKVTVKTSSSGAKTAMWLKANTCYTIELTSTVKNGYFKVRRIYNMDSDYEVRMHGSTTGYWISCNDLVCYLEAGWGRRSVYASPSTSSALVTVIDDGTPCTPLAVSGNWVKVRCNGRVGWVKNEGFGASA